MTPRVYIVRIPLPGSDQYIDLCRCENADNAAAVVKAMLQAAEGAPIRLIVESQIGG